MFRQSDRLYRTDFYREYDALSQKEQKEYDRTDTVGKAGIEKTMDTTLKGKKGTVKLYVNNVGKVLDTVQGKKAKAGNDLYLTIDADLQVAAYNILEQELAGIILSKLQNTLNYDRTKVSDGSDVIIPVGDVYNSFISNDILDMTHFSDDDAKSTEKAVHKTFSSNKKAVLKKLKKMLNSSGAAAYKDQSKEYQAYLSYLVNDMLTSNNKVLLSGKIDSSDKTYKAWHDSETINIKKYLNYAISKNMVDTSKLTNYMPKKRKIFGFYRAIQSTCFVYHGRTEIKQQF